MIPDKLHQNVIVLHACTYIYNNNNKRSVLRIGMQSRDTNRNIKRLVYCQYSDSKSNVSIVSF